MTTSGPAAANSSGTTPRYVVLSGGVGGARFVRGLAAAAGPGAVTVIGNTGDDFVHLGLAISPDLDTVMYTLAGVVNESTGWGRADEGWNFLATVTALGGEDWFRLGDRDLAVHVERTRQLGVGRTLTAVTGDLCQRFGLATRLIPMSDAPVHTLVNSDAGELAFQEYFVRRRAEPRVLGLRYAGAAAAPPSGPVAAAFTDPGLAAVFIGPSNPWLSIGPMLAIPSLAAALRSVAVPVVAISPIVAGRAIKGPAARIMADLGVPVSAIGIAEYYRGVAGGLILDHADAGLAPAVGASGLAAGITGTLMIDTAAATALARYAIGFAATLRRR
jgi:LPPG:FO 2-phospho-L-lactate transferase